METIREARSLQELDNIFDAIDREKDCGENTLVLHYFNKSFLNLEYIIYELSTCGYNVNITYTDDCRITIEVNW